MSIIYCDRHDLQWDSDKTSECPICECEGGPITQRTTCEFCEPDGYANHAPRCPVSLKGEIYRLRAELSNVVEQCAKVCEKISRSKRMEEVTNPRWGVDVAAATIRAISHGKRSKDGI